MEVPVPEQFYLLLFSLACIDVILTRKMYSWCNSVAAAENAGLPKSFDFTSEERIYNWY